MQQLKTYVFLHEIIYPSKITKKTDESVMEAFSGKGLPVTDTPVRTRTKLSASQEATDNRLNRMSKKFVELIIT